MQFQPSEQGLRLAIGVSIVIFLGYSVHTSEKPPQGLTIDFVTHYHTCLQIFFLWWAMTMVQISGDQIGGVMRDALRRTLGAFIGGILGSIAVVMYRNHPPYPCTLVALFSGLVMYGMQTFSKISGKRRALDLSLQVYVKIIFVGKLNGFEQIISIIIGVVCGVITMALLSAVILPRSSTYKAMVHMKLSLKKLGELCRFTMAKLDMINSSQQYTRIYPLQYDENHTYQLKVEENLDCFENKLYEIYHNLDKCMESLKVAKSETCLIQRRTKHGAGWLVFPGTHWFGESCF
eukprot:TRINITY_DN4312_c0_g1_i11.p1 TRINITY_DN4312_c0_g1~~TRINITY_DN4312_c0_g1_i11.p1  ORF type:complete len:291 (+),score=13.85 TRINITY_DN4312_c0_g1_i11:121-993(+)